MNHTVKEKVYDILAEVFSISREQISDEIGPGDLRAWDSLGQLELLTGIEREFNLRLSVDDIVAIESVADIVRIVEEKES